MRQSPASPSRRESRAKVDFSDVYLRTPARFVVRRDGPALAPTPSGLKGRTIAVVARTAHEAYLAAFSPRSRASSMTPPMRPAPRSRRARSTPISATASSWVSGCRASLRAIAAVSPAAPISSRASSASASPSPCRAGQVDLKRALNAALETLHDKGVYAELYLRYFPVGFF